MSIEGISRISKLKNFIFVGGYLTTIPEELYLTTSLEEFSLTQNSISELSGKIGNLKKLRVLELDNNYLTAIPK